MTFPESYPAVVGVIATPAGLRLLKKKALPVDAIELRVDHMLANKVAVEEMEAALAKRLYPVLTTLRIPAEGGAWKWGAKERRELFLRLLPQVEAIDVELASVGAMKGVIAEARRLRKPVIFSAHSLQRPATPLIFARWLSQFEQAWLQNFEPVPQTMLKVASQIKSWHDLKELAGLLVNHHEWPLVVMGTGPFGTQSRSVLTSLGSRLIYGYLDKSTAPGQPSAKEAREIALASRVL